MKAFVDTSGFYALASSNHENHGRAREAFERLILEETPLYTSSYVLLETAQLIQQQMGYAALRTFLDSVMEGFSIIWIAERVHRDACNLMQLHRREDSSFVNYTTALLAREIGAHVLSFSVFFESMGLKTLPQPLDRSSSEALRS